eukprot:4678451-Pyramimonas_sp.AAC.1
MARLGLIGNRGPPAQLLGARARPPPEGPWAGMAQPWRSLGPSLPRRPRKAIQAAKMARHAPKTAQEDSKTAQDGPVTTQDGLKMAETAQEGSQRKLRRAPRGPPSK